MKAVAFLLLLTLPAVAGQRPLSAPDRAPIPLTDIDQQRARREEQKKNEGEANKEEQKKKASAADSPAESFTTVNAPATRHVSTGNAALDALVREASARSGIDPCLIISLMRQESGFNSLAVSPKGAMGLMQLMPETAARFGVSNVFDATENVFAGTRYLRWLLDRFSGDLRLALAAYNAGEGAVESYGNRIPPFLETQNYVRLIYARYSSIHSDLVAEAPAKEAQKPAASAEKLPTHNQITRFGPAPGANPKP